MAIVQEFKYLKPGKLDQAVRYLSELEKPAILAGGTDLVAELKGGVASPGTVIDIKGITGLDGLTFDDSTQTLDIGALVTFSQLIQSELIREKFPLIAEMAQKVASKAVRNRATMAGNICSAVPCMDSGPVLMVYEARLNLTGPDGNQTLPVSQWFKGPRQTAVKTGELVTSITVPLPAGNHGGCYLKLGRYKGEDLAQASVAILALQNNRYRVAFGSVAPTPVRAAEIETLMNGKSPDDDLMNAALDLIPKEIKPISDVRASKEYRMHMCKIMFTRGLKAAVARMNDNGPAYGTPLI